MNITTTQISNVLFAFIDLQFSSDLNSISSQPLEDEGGSESLYMKLSQTILAILYHLQSISMNSLRERFRGMSDLSTAFTFRETEEILQTQVIENFEWFVETNNRNFHFYLFDENWTSMHSILLRSSFIQQQTSVNKLILSISPSIVATACRSLRMNRKLPMVLCIIFNETRSDRKRWLDFVRFFPLIMQNFSSKHKHRIWFGFNEMQIIRLNTRRLRSK